MTSMDPTTPQPVATLCAIARLAGAAVMEIYRRGGEVWTKDDASPLTEADLGADAVIRQGLESAFPGVFILSEESASTGAKGEDSFLVDPLDGTKEFLRRSGEFTVNIAWLQRGRLAAGVVFAPALDELFWARPGAGAWKQVGTAPPVRLQVAAVDGTAPLRVIGSRSHGTRALADWLARLGAAHQFVAAGSSLKFCRIAEGGADLYPRFGPTSQWDTAAAQCVLEEAGGLVIDLAGEPLAYGRDRPILNPHFVALGDRALQRLVAPVSPGELDPMAD